MANKKTSKESKNKKEINFKSVKVKNVKNNNLSQEGNEIRKFIITFAIVVVIIIGVYFLSTIIVNKRDKSDNKSVAGEINYDLVSVGTILNRPYNDYYVMVYNSEDTDAIYYSSLISGYLSKEDSLKMYFCDLNNKLNSNYVSESESGNVYARLTEEFSFGKVTLLEIRNNQIVRYIEDIDTIKSVLK